MEQAGVALGSVGRAAGCTGHQETLPALPLTLGWSGLRHPSLHPAPGLCLSSDATAESTHYASSFAVVQSLGLVRLCDPMDNSMPDFTVLHYLPELAQTHVH